jgi:signal transduction histidine kinase
MMILRTLVVDDELGMRLSIQRTLNKFKLSLPHVDEDIGFDVDIAETGEEAVEKINKNNPDLLLLDYKLPGMSGLDILDRITNQESEMITIMITAFASIEVAVVAIKRGAFDFLPKPFTPQELKNNVAKAAERLILARQVKKLAQEKNKVRFQLLSVLGHELKAPLNSIDGYLDIMAKKRMGENISAYDHIIDRCNVRLEGMRKLILDLLDLTRMESGEKKRELQKQNIRTFAELSIETLLPEAEKRNITVFLHSDPQVPMHCDSSEIEIIFNNLVSNAVKYNRDGGTVNIFLKAENGIVTIEVKDTGIGMTEEEAAKLFQEFVRIKNEKTKNILGSGLGLTIVKKIAKSYNGDITVKSVPDVGSSFIVTLQDRE